MLRRFFLLALTAALAASSCSQNEDAASDETTTTTTVVPASTAAPATTATVEPATTTAPPNPSTTVAATSTTVVVPEPPVSLFDMTTAEIEAASAPVLAVALSVAESLDSDDLNMLRSVFVPNGYVIDPVVASLRPQLGGWFSIFQRICPEVSSSDIYVNADGSATAWECYGMYEGFVDDPPDPNSAIRHIQMEGDLARYLINPIDAEVLEAYPAETSDVIGFPVSQEAAILSQAQTAQRFAADYVEAWQSGETSQILDLYATDGARNDTFAGLRDDPGTTNAWLLALDRDYSEITVDIETLQASDLGPSAEYRLTLGDGNESCVMRMVSMWNLNDEDLIVRESVFYHPDTIFDCRWQPADS